MTRTLQPLLLLPLCLLLHLSLSAQAVISHRLQLGDTSQVHTLRTVRGDQFIGRLTRIEDERFYFLLRHIDEPTIFALSEIAFIGLAEETYDPGRRMAKPGNEAAHPKDNYLPVQNLVYTASAFPYDGGGAYRNTLLLYNIVDLQWGPNVTIGGGLVLPVAVLARLKAAFSLTPTVHLGAMVQHFQTLIESGALTHGYLLATVGTREKYLNFGLGYWHDHVERETHPTLDFGASWVFAPRWRFFAEVFVVFDSFDNPILPTVNFAHFRRAGVFEFGIAGLPDSGLPIIPLISYTHQF